MKVRILSVFVAGAFFISGCATTVVKPIAPGDLLQAKKKQLIGEGNSTDFADGYTDGCASGKRVVGDERYIAEKDSARYMINQDYSIGWEQGYYECRDEDITRLQQEVRQEYTPASNAAEEMERAKIWEEVKK